MVLQRKRLRVAPHCQMLWLLSSDAEAEERALTPLLSFLSALSQYRNLVAPASRCSVLLSSVGEAEEMEPSSYRGVA